MIRKFPLLAVIILLFAGLSPVQSQSVGIGTLTPDNNAMLDVKSNTKGMLLPRTSTVSRLAILNPARGLILYDTITRSFWFHNGSLWTEIATAGNAWGLTGNNGTNQASNFIGTTDVQPLRFRVNNLWAGEIHPSSGNLFSGLGAGKANTTASQNTAIGTNALTLQSFDIGGSFPFSITGNTAVGFDALYSNQPAGAFSGIYNTAVGHSSLRSNTTGYYNTAIGYLALFSNTTAISNTAVGTGAGYNNTIGTAITAIGFKALYNNTNGNENTAIGKDALGNNTTASQNTAIGTNTLNTQSYNNGGSNWVSGNVAVGFEALYLNNPTSVFDGVFNTSIGHSALRNNSTGSYNTASGCYALYLNSSGFDNTAAGDNALYSNTMGNQNTANGSNALSFNTTASRNTAIGTNALFTQSYNNGGNSWESGNVAVGYDALYLNQPKSIDDGVQNTGVGNYALQVNTIGKYNAAFGSNSLIKNNTGISNTASGFQSLYSNTTGSYNTAIGYQALYYNVGGNRNIAIGSGSGTHPGSPNTTNTISIGNDDILNAASNQAFIGNTSTAWIGGQVGWFHYSDARIKTNIKEEVSGLDFILRLRPVTYNKNLQKLREITGNKETKDFQGKYDIEKIKFSGFLAQEVEKAAIESGYDFDGIHKPQNEHDLYSLSYAEFVVPLVKAVQEQQAMIISLQRQSANTVEGNTKQIEQQQAIILQQQQQILLLEKRLAALELRQ